MSTHGWVDETRNWNLSGSDDGVRSAPHILGDYIEGEWPVRDEKASERMLARMQGMIAELQPPLVRVSPFVSSGHFIISEIPGERRMILTHQDHVAKLRADGYEIEQESGRR